MSEPESGLRRLSRRSPMKKKPSTPPLTLPRGAGLDVGALSRVFDSRTNSYKFLWMLSLLDVLGENQFKPGPIPARRVVLHMLRNADAPLRRFRLSLGPRDQTAKHVESLCASTSLSPRTDIERLIVSQAAFEAAQKELLHYVPQRFLTPFFQSELLSVPDDERDDKLRRYAAKKFNASSPPLYRLDGGRLDRSGGKPLTVVLNRRWLTYLKRNAEIVRGWILWHWAGYLESRNPNVPGIIAKIAHPESRESIARQREFWGAVVAELGGVSCIYSGARLRVENDYDLDHFIPWSFAGHNNLWNLVPALKEANALKSDSLPGDKYFDKMVSVQRKALKVYRAAFSGEWEDLMNAYDADLKVNPQLPWTQSALAEQYRRVVPPLLSLAQSMGFRPDWDYKNAMRKKMKERRDKLTA